MKKIIYSVFLITLFFLFAQAPIINAYSLPNVEKINGTESTEPTQLSNIVIYIKFNDESAYHTPHSFSYYVDLFNGVDTVSLRDYYLEASYNQLEINSYFTSSTEIIYYNDIYDRSYYQPYDGTQNPDGYSESERTVREHELLKRALNFVEDNNLIEDSINIDTNDDGIVDSVSFLVSGNDDGWNSLLWPHKWSLFTYIDYYDDFTFDAPTINGKHIDPYTFELLGKTVSYDYAVDVAVLAHETFHLIGAPDLYHYYRYDWIQAVGYWGLMENLGTNPNHMLGYMKETYGNWITNVDEIISSGTYTLYPLQDSPDNLYKYNTGISNEYIYFEYRDSDGLYEGNLLDTGLLVYRVDLDFYDQGNVEGYYNDSGITEEEVFVFRPGIIYSGTTIEFPDFDDEDIDEDGDIDKAILSDTNTYDSMGIGTDIPMFSSNGELLNIQVTNVVEHDGYITFDVVFPPSITLDTDMIIDEKTDLYLVDLPRTQYEVSVNNIPNNAAVYYTLDGSVPNINSLQYLGDNILIDSLNNEVNVAIYLNGLLYQSLSEIYHFTESIETNHNPYGNMENISWLIQYTSESDLTLSFLNNFSFEEDFDYLYISDDTSTASYTGMDLVDQELSYSTNSILLQFVSDEYLDDYYGFSCEVTSNSIYGIELIGVEDINVDVFDVYIDEGYSLNFENTLYYVTVNNTVNVDTIGTYEVSYFLYDNLDELIMTVTRTINVVDGISPNISLIGESSLTLDVFDSYIEQGVNILDNYDTEELEYVVVGSVDTDVIGSYTLTYQTMDSSGNISNEITRTVHVVDTAAPELTLNGDTEVTVEVFEGYSELGVTMTDNYDLIDVLQYAVTGNADTDVIGSYTLTYSVTDSSGNISDEINRIVHVVDTQPPFLSLNASVDTLYVNQTYVEKSIAYADNYDDELTIEIIGSVSTETAHVYEILYRVEDSSGNYSTLSRFVSVIEPEQIEFVCSQTQTTYIINSTYQVPTCTVNEVNVPANTSAINSVLAGTYEILYEFERNSVTYTYRTYIFFYGSDSISNIAVLARKEDLV